MRLWYGSAHQSALFPIATSMPDFLVELLDDRPAAVQVQVLMGLAKHAEPHCYHLGYPGLLPQVFEFGQEAVSREGARELTGYERTCLRTWEAVGRHVDRYVGLLSDEHAEVVAAALYLLSLLKEWPQGTPDTIRSLASDSAAGERRASAYMALGMHAWSRGEGLEVLGFPKESTPSEREVRVSQAITAAHNHIADNRTLLDTLAAGSQLPRLVFDRFPWCAGAIAGPAAEAMTVLSLDLEADVLEALIAALLHHHREGQEKCDDEDWEWPVPELVSEHLVRFAFRSFLGRTHEVTIEELTPAQRRILVVLFEVGCHPAALTHAGIRRLSRRMVGLDPPGPLDRPLTFNGPAGVQAWPIWKWWWLALRGEVSEDDLVRDLVRTYGPKEVADIAIDMTRGDYDIMSRTPHHLVPLAQRLMKSVAPGGGA